MNIQKILKFPTFLAKIKTTEINYFFRKLATLIQAGIPLVQALHMLSQHSQSHLTPILITIKTDIETGKTFSASLQKFPRYFDNMTCSLLTAGEKSGTLDIMLERVAHYKEKASALKNKIKQALLYPSLIILTATLVGLTMLLFVVPRFADLFQSMNSELPLFTLIIIRSANFLLQHFLLFLVLIISLCTGVFYSYQTDTTREKIEQYLVNLPVIGANFKKIILARLSRCLATLFTAGIPITEAIKIITPITGTIIYTKALIKLHRDICSGKQLHIAMQSSPLFPLLTLQMIQVGEESGTLDKMLGKIADFYEADLDNLATHLGHLLEPLIMMILGVLIGGLVIAMYLPIFKLGTVI